MRHNKFDKKIRFSYLLPYGLISPAGLELDINTPGDAYIDYMPDKPMEDRIRNCFRAHKSRLEALGAMEDYGYIEKVKIKYGSAHQEEVRMYRLTRAGFYFLTNTPDATVETKRIDSLKRTKRNLKNNTYLDTSTEALEIRKRMYALAQQGDATSALMFRDLLYAALEDGYLTVLASETALAENVQIPGWLRSHQQYRLCRLANVEALFKSNRFLTSIDRRPMQFTLGKSKSSDAAPDLWDIPTFVQYTLDKWYREEPDSFTFCDPVPDASERKRQAWEVTPAFYSVQEIPGFEGIMNETKGMQMRGANTLLRHSFVGVAIGRKTNYIVYHTKPSKTPWHEAIERSTAMAVKRAIDLSARIEESEEKNSPEEETNPVPESGADDLIKNAIMVCTTVFQFASLFDQAKQHMPKRWAKEKRVGRPYKSVCIVPLNHSGSMQLRCLMLSTPAEYESIIVNNLLTYPGFSERPPGKDARDNIYRLSYNKRPVLVAHGMEFQKLYWAMEDYLEGKEFYVSCYPEQAKYIQKIMPNVQFL